MFCKGFGFGMGSVVRLCSSERVIGVRWHGKEVVGRYGL